MWLSWQWGRGRMWVSPLAAVYMHTAPDTLTYAPVDLRLYTPCAFIPSRRMHARRRSPRTPLASHPCSHGQRQGSEYVCGVSATVVHLSSPRVPPCTQRPGSGGCSCLASGGTSTTAFCCRMPPRPIMPFSPSTSLRAVSAPACLWQLAKPAALLAQPGSRGPRALAKGVSCAMAANSPAELSRTHPCDPQGESRTPRSTQGAPREGHDNACLCKAARAASAPAIPPGCSGLQACFTP